MFEKRVAVVPLPGEEMVFREICSCRDCSTSSSFFASSASSAEISGSGSVVGGTVPTSKTVPTSPAVHILEKRRITGSDKRKPFTYVPENSMRAVCEGGGELAPIDVVEVNNSKDGFIIIRRRGICTRTRRTGRARC